MVQLDRNISDYITEVNEQRKSIAEDLTEYGWNFNEEQEQLGNLYITTLFNKFFAVVITFDEENNSIITRHYNRYAIEKLHNQFNSMKTKNYIND